MIWVTVKSVAPPATMTSRYETKSLRARLARSQRMMLLGPRWRVEAVAYAAYRLEIPRRCGDLQQFLAQVGHVHIDDMVVVILVTPHVFEQLGTREHPPGMGRQGGQELKLARGERHNLVVMRHLLTSHVEHERPKLVDRWGEGVERRSTPRPTQ